MAVISMGRQIVGFLAIRQDGTNEQSAFLLAINVSLLFYWACSASEDYERGFYCSLEDLMQNLFTA